MSYCPRELHTDPRPSKTGRIEAQNDAKCFEGSVKVNDMQINDATED